MLKNTLDQILHNKEEKWWDISLEDHWTGLWNELSNVLNKIENPSENYFLVANSQMPEGINRGNLISLNLNLSPYFGSLTWAACQIISRANLDEPSKKQCGIILVLPESNPTTEIEKHLESVYSTINPDGTYARGAIGNVIILRQPSIVQITAAIINFDAGEKLPEVTQSTSDLLSSILRGSLLSDREQNHAVSNVIAAKLLAKDQSSDSIDNHLNTLTRSAVTTLDIDQIQGASSLFSEKLHIALIDDMVDLWAPVVENCFKPSCQNNITKINPLEGKLEQLFQWLKNCSPEAQIENAPESIWLALGMEKPGAILLDLRLFDLKSEQAKTFYLKLQGIAANFPDNLKKFWLNDDELNYWEASCKSFDPSKEVPSRLLPLLAQLLSMADPFLPIIIFSSTHDSRISESFAPFGNIITTFRKPTINSLSEGDIRPLDNLVQALDIAHSLNKISSLLDDVRPEQDPPQQDEKCAYLFLDESGTLENSEMVVGGIGIIGKHDAVKTHTAAMLKSAPKPGICQGQEPDLEKSTDYYYKRPENYIAKKADWANTPEGRTNKATEYYQKIVDLFEEWTVNDDENSLEFFAFTWKFTPKSTERGKIFGEQPDKDHLCNLLDHGFQGAMEKMLGAVLFDILGNEKCKVSLDFATRDTVVNMPYNPHSIEDESLSVQQFTDQIRKNYGLNTSIRANSRNNTFEVRCAEKSIGEREPVNMVEKVLQDRNGTQAPRISTARAVTLLDWGNQPWEFSRTVKKDVILPKEMHYLADLLVRAEGTLLYRNGDIRTQQNAFLSSIESWFKNGFRYDETDKDTPNWPKMLRDWDTGRKVDAVNTLLTIHAKGKWDKLPSCARKRVENWKPKDLTVSDLRKIFRTYIHQK